jgi:hypothetical protein
VLFSSIFTFDQNTGEIHEVYEVLGYICCIIGHTTETCSYDNPMSGSGQHASSVVQLWPVHNKCGIKMAASLEDYYQ